MENKLVRKSNYLIEAAYKLSAVEQKIILVLASMIRSKDREFKPYVLKIKNFSRFIELDSKADYEYLKAVTKTLLEKVFVVKTPDSEIQTHWLSSVEYSHGKGSVAFTFDPKLKPFLLQLKERFTTYRLQDVVQLRSSFSIRMYELLKEYEKIGFRIFELANLKIVLGLMSHQYSLYGDFKRRVILTAQRELKAKTDVAFDFEEIKLGRAVVKIRFKIFPNTASGRKTSVPLPKELSVISELDTLTRLLPETYQKSQAVKRILLSYLEMNGVAYVARNIQYANARSNAVNAGAAIGKGSNYRNYLAKALRGDFGLAFEEDQEAQSLAKETQYKSKLAREQAEKSRLEQLEREQQDNARAQAYQTTLSVEELQALREEALESMDVQQRNLVLKKSTGSRLLLKMAMNRLCMERLSINSQTLAEKEKTQER